MLIPCLVTIGLMSAISFPDPFCMDGSIMYSLEILFAYLCHEFDNFGMVVVITAWGFHYVTSKDV